MARRVITLLGQPIVTEDGVAGEAITPGMLVEGQTTIMKHSGGTVKSTRFALEREEMGKDIDTDYAVDDVVKVGTFKPGERVNALVASGVNVAADVELESAGDGTLQALTTGVAIGRAVEAVNATALTRLRTELV